MRLKPFVIAAIVLLTAAASAPAKADPVFGPQTFERTTGSSDAYAETFQSPVDGRFVLYVRNGDEEGTRASSGSISVNGVEVVRPSDLNEQVPGLSRSVRLQAGTNEIDVVLHGSPGAFVTVAIVPRGEPAVFVAGRLLLPWGRNDGEALLALALKNGSHRFPRAVRVVFFNPQGEVVAKSGRILLPPRASVARSSLELMTDGNWTAGSIEVFYAGPGLSRVFGSARQADLTLDSSEVQTLSHAGHHLFRGGGTSGGLANSLIQRLGGGD
jgi:hypothetical protein